MKTGFPELTPETTEFKAVFSSYKRELLFLPITQNGIPSPPVIRSDL
jgi:hypothetical protein